MKSATMANITMTVVTVSLHSNRYIKIILCYLVIVFIINIIGVCRGCSVPFARHNFYSAQTYSVIGTHILRMQNVGSLFQNPYQSQKNNLKKNEY